MALHDDTGFAVLDHPADMGLEAWAPTLAQLFGQAAYALTSILVDVENLEEKPPHESLHVSLDSGDLEGLMFDFLSEILFQFDCERKVFPVCQVCVDRTAELFCLQAELNGQAAPPAEEIKTYVKAVTFHQMKIEEKDGVWKATVYLDI